MDSIRLKVSKIWQQQANVPSEEIDASLVLRQLGEVPRRAVAKPRMRARLLCQLRFNTSYFSIEAVLGVLLAERPESKKNA
jgi:hypothetical protein